MFLNVQFSRRLVMLITTAVFLASGTVVTASAQDATPGAEMDAPRISSSNIYWDVDTDWAFEQVPDGVSTIVIDESGMTSTFNTTGLAPGHVVTVWIAVFNHPEFCTHGDAFSQCGGLDLLIDGGDEAIEATMLFGGGHVIGPDGKGTFSWFLPTGDDTGVFLDTGPGLTNPSGAFVHLIIRDHGPVLPGMLSDQVSSFGGGCIDPPEGEGIPGDYPCLNLQFAVHEPGSDSEM